MATNSGNSQEVRDALFAQGVLVDLNIGHWSGQRVLRAEDLGLAPDRVDPELLTLGRKRLIPKAAIDKFASADVNARYHLRKFGFRFPFGNAVFVPYSVYDQATAKLRELRREWGGLVAELVSEYPALKAVQLGRWRQAARKAGIDGDELVARIEALLPGERELSSRFRFSWQVFAISLPENGRVNALDEAQVAGRIQAIEDARQFSIQTLQGFVADCAQALRQQAGQLAAEVRQRMADGGQVPARTMMALRERMARWRDLNFIGDNEFEIALNDIHHALAAEPGGGGASFSLALSGLAAQTAEMLDGDRQAVIVAFTGRSGRRIKMKNDEEGKDESLEQDQDPGP